MGGMLNDQVNMIYYGIKLLIIYYTYVKSWAKKHELIDIKEFIK